MYGVKVNCVNVLNTIACTVLYTAILCLTLTVDYVYGVLYTVLNMVMCIMLNTVLYNLLHTALCTMLKSVQCTVLNTVL
jgi:hypothetical protein